MKFKETFWIVSLFFFFWGGYIFERCSKQVWDTAYNNLTVNTWANTGSELAGIFLFIQGSRLLKIPVVKTT